MSNKPDATDNLAEMICGMASRRFTPREQVAAAIRAAISEQVEPLRKIVSENTTAIGRLEIRI